MESTNDPINPKSVYELVREQPARFRSPEEAQRLCALLPRVQGGDLYSYSALIRELAGLRLLHEGVQLLIRMDTERIDITAQVFNIVLDGYVNQGVTEGVEELVNIMKTRHVQMDKYTYTTLMRHYAQQGDVDKCKQLLQNVTRSKIPLDEHMLGALVECFFTAGKEDNALRVPEVMQATFGLKPSIGIFNVILKQLVKRGQTDEAFRVVRERLQEDVRPDEITYTLLMQAAVRGGIPDKAVELFDALKRAGLRPGVPHYSLLVSAHAARNDLDRAVALLDEMAARRVAPDSRLYDHYAKECLDRGNVRAMLDVCARMDEMGVRMDRQTGIRVMRFLDAVKIEDPTTVDIESLLALVRAIHKHDMGYRATIFLEPFLDKCKKEQRAEEAVNFMGRVFKAGGPKLHKTYYFSFAANKQLDPATRELLTDLHTKGLFK